MSSLNKPYTFTANTYAVAAQVNSDFDTLYSWANTNAIWADGTNAFTAIPVGPNSDPTALNQLTRKQYVDQCPHIVGGYPGYVPQFDFSDFATANTVTGGGFIFAFNFAFANIVDHLQISLIDTTDLGVNVGQAPSTTTAHGHVYTASTGAAYVGAINFSYFAVGH